MKVLIIENETDHLLSIKRTLKQEFGDHMDLSPTYLGDGQHNYSYNDYLIGKLIERDFDGVVGHYSQVDLFIVDVFLLNKADKTGLDFCKHLLQKVPGDYKIIVISNNYIPNEISGKENKVFFFSKYEGGIHFPLDLVKVIRNIFQMDAPAVATVAAVTIGPTTAPVTRGIAYQAHELWKYCKSSLNRLIDKLIYISFYVLLVASVLYAVSSILFSIYKAVFHAETPDTMVNDGDTSILKTAEHIFLYLLPVFIVFGFFHYYKNHSRISLLDGVPDSNDDVNSTKTMNLTKILFVSSIISYVLIKVIEEVFVKKTVDITRLVAFGLFLVMLMGYFLFLDKRRH